VITLLPLQAVAREHEVVLFVRPGETPSFPRRLLRRDPLDVFARRSGIERAWMPSADDATIVERLRRARPDVICVSSFRWLLPAAVLDTAPRGAFNVHSSLLPRHRGAVPLFWIFHEDDRETGVTVHRLTSRADAGEIVGSDRWELARGTTADDLNAMNAERGAALLQTVLRRIERGEEQSSPQDESRMTRAPKVPRSGRTIDFDSWPAERVWHFLNGVFPYYTEEIGHPYAGVVGWEKREGGGEPGSVEETPDELRLRCIDGVVRLRKGR